MSKINAHHEAQNRPDVLDLAAGVFEPLMDAGGDAISYGWKPRTAPTVILPSAKNRCDVPVYDEFELAFARQAERSPMVELYEARPCLMGMFRFNYVPSFQVALSFGYMLVEITRFGNPTDEGEARRAAAIQEHLDDMDVMFAQFTTFEVSRCKLFGRSLPLRPRSNDYWLRAKQAEAAALWADFK